MSHNLIDLSIEEVEEQTQSDILLDSKCEHERLTNETRPSNSSCCPLLIPEGLNCNLPLSSRRESLDNNPFDQAQKEANLLDDPFEIVSKEAEKRGSTLVQDDIQTDNLLLLIDYQNNAGTSSRLQSMESNRISSISSLEPFDDNVFGSSPTVSDTIFTTDSPTKSGLENAESPDVSKKSGKSEAYRKRLLKLSISNSSQNSPLSIMRRSSRQSEDSPNLSSVLSEAGSIADKFLGMACNSPRQFEDSCDDLMSLKPHWVDSDDIDSDLEMMSIPILQEIASPIVESKMSDFAKIAGKAKSAETSLNSSNESSKKHSPDLAALREKVRQRVAEKGQEVPPDVSSPTPNDSEINSLISTLKSFVLERSNDAQKVEANTLFDTLNTILTDKDKDKEEHENENKEDNTDKLSVPTPPPIVRQGTFDIDLKDNEEKKEGDEETEETGGEEVAEDAEGREEAEEEQEEEMTDDRLEGDESAEQEEFQSPPQMNDLVEQIGKLLGNQNVNVLQGNFGGACPSTPNPTYIVVMGTPLPSKYHRTSMYYNNMNDGSPELSQSQMRGRSQSLSIHDKSSMTKIKSPPKPDCRTPMRQAPSSVRRNSFSTPVATTPTSNTARRSIYATGKETVTKPTLRRSVLGTNADKPKIDLPTKPVGKSEINPKKLKMKTTESVAKPTGPLKATIPIKKVAPMIIAPSISSPNDEAVLKPKTMPSTPRIHVTAAKMFPNACSTPAVEASPSKGLLKPKPRYSYVSTTPNPKSSASSNGQFRRRTLSEIKSPKKSSESSKPSVGGITRPLVKTLKLPQNFSKTLNKIIPPLSKTKVQNAAATGTEKKNKENKTPRFGM